MPSPVISPDDDNLRAFWAKRIICSVTLLRPDGRMHVTPMGIVLDGDIAWGITNGSSFKARIVGQGATPVAICQIDGRYWSTLYGTASLRTDEASIATAVASYAGRYRTPRENPDRVAIHIEIDRMTGNIPALDAGGAS